MKKFLLNTGILAATAVGIHKIPRPLKAIMLGNLPAYLPSTEVLNPSSKLYGKRIAFLGSSITYGAAAKGKSFVESTCKQKTVLFLLNQPSVAPL